MNIDSVSAEVKIIKIIAKVWKENNMYCQF